MWGSSIVINLSPHWGPPDPSGVQSRFYVCISLRLSLCQVFPHHFLAIIKAWPVISLSAYALVTFTILVNFEIYIKQNADNIDGTWIFSQNAENLRKIRIYT